MNTVTPVTGTFTPPADGDHIYHKCEQHDLCGHRRRTWNSLSLPAGVPTVTISNAGRGYTAGETITIPGGLIGGVNVTNDLDVNLATVSASNKGIFSDYQAEFTLTQAVGTNPTMDSTGSLGITDGTNSVVSTTTDWVEEKSTYSGKEV